MSQSHLSRRAVLKALGAATVAGGVKVVADTSRAEARPTGTSPGARPIIVGRVSHLDRSGNLIVMGHGQTDTTPRPIQVKLLASTSYSRGAQGLVAGPTVYVPGDWIVVEGQWSGDQFEAADVSSVYEAAQGQITNRVNDQLDTTVGSIWLLPNTQPVSLFTGAVAPALSQLKAGDRLAALVWRDPTDDRVLALKLGTS